MPAGADPVVRPLPGWLRRWYLVAAGLAVAFAPALWLLRNLASDTVFFNRTSRLRTEEAYQTYIRDGWLHVGRARRELPRVALDQATRMRTASALRGFLGRYPGSPLEAEARAALDKLYRTALESDRPPTARPEPLGVDELLAVLERMDTARVNMVALAGFIPPTTVVAECGKEWRARLPGAATPAKSLLARALLRGSCDAFLPDLVAKDKALLGPYRIAVEMELGAPSPTTALALRQIRDYGIVKAHATLFSPTLGAELLEAIRRSKWAPGIAPAVAEVEALKTALAADAALREAVLDFMQPHAARWPPPAGDPKDAAHRAHLQQLLDLSRRVGSLGRPELASQIAKQPLAAFRAEVDAYAKKAPNEIVQFLNSGGDNPFVGDLIDKLAAAGKPLLAYSLVGEGSSFAGSAQAALASQVGQRMLLVACSAPACDRVPRRVRVRSSESSTDYCYDKLYFGSGYCSNRGRRITLTFTYLKDNQVVGTDTVSGETPSVVRYRIHSGIDTGPSSTDVYSATLEAVQQELNRAKLRLPF
jgi:hypothetical protein